MPETKTKKPKKTKKGMKTKLFFMPADNHSAEEEDIHGEEEGERGMYLEKEDVKLIYNALRKYTPAEKEMQRYELLLESFDEILVVDYNEKPME